MTESDERKFIHDIASPIGTALFLVDMLYENLKDRSEPNSDEVNQAKQTLDLLEKIKTMLEQRREILIQRGVPSSKGN